MLTGRHLVNRYTLAATVGLGAALYQAEMLRISLSVAVYVVVLFIGLIIGFSLVASSGRQRRPSSGQSLPSSSQALILKMMEMRTRKKKRKRRGVVISRAMDKAIKEVFDLVVQDFIMVWYRDLGKDYTTFISALEDDMWELITNLVIRLQKVDMVRFMALDVTEKLCDHFRELRETSPSTEGGGKLQPFQLHPCLKSDIAETEFLREATEVLLVLLLPERIASSETARHVIREIVTCSVIKPAIDTLCSPSYVNNTLLIHLEYTEQLAKKHNRNYMYSATYEDFIKLINSCHDTQELQQIRYHILTEIMQATNIQNMKKAKGLEVGTRTSKGAGKGELLKARNLKRYLNQCRFAKAHCERRIRQVGGPEYQMYFRNRDEEDGVGPMMVILLEEIFQDKQALEYFNKFLQKEGKDDLLNFWKAVEKLKNTKKKDQHKVANDLYQTYVATTSAVKVDKALVKQMQAYLVGNKGPEAFYDAQTKVYELLDEDYYPSFLVSEYYAQFCQLSSRVYQERLSKQRSASDEELRQRYNTMVQPSPMADELESSSVSIAEQTNAILRKLQQCEEKMENKVTALSNIKTSANPDAKMQQTLEREIEMLKVERRQLELYIERTDLWCEHIGKWRTDICNAEQMEDGEKNLPYYVIVVHPIDPNIPIHGWVVSRRLNDFHTLHKRIKDCSKLLAKLELPQMSRRPFKNLDKEFLETSKAQLQDYLTSILKDDTLKHSEAVYRFLVPSPTPIQNASEEKEKKAGFSFSGIFKNTPEPERTTDDVDTEDESPAEVRDSIAKPMYSLIEEVFELRGMFKWLRRTLIVFVQATFGGTINREIRSTVDWLFSEPMIIYYVHYFRNAMWPEGKFVQMLDPKTKAEDQQIKQEAKERFLKNIPDILQNTVGGQNSRLGFAKIFEAFQDELTNKHLFYVLFEMVLLELCPELRDPKLLKKLEELEAQSRNGQLSKQGSLDSQDGECDQQIEGLKHEEAVQKLEQLKTRKEIEQREVKEDRGGGHKEKSTELKKEE
ncbi:sorting nexin-25-like isoform X2 [Anneissia japonica]|uniref:sorting nexin-25-like isoform X2 n=1 Tax=Anneissia japonica TaxID=1529436 RepID=UPI001425ADB2|nr:sorting nexin-25-like isoform X2 [Anneissia japonica]